MGKGAPARQSHGIADLRHRTCDMRMVRHLCSRVEVEQIRNTRFAVKPAPFWIIGRGIPWGWLLFEVIPSNLFLRGSAAIEIALVE